MATTMVRTKVLEGFCTNPEHQAEIAIQPWTPIVPTLCPGALCCQPITWVRGRTTR